MTDTPKVMTSFQQEPLPKRQPDQKNLNCGTAKTGPLDPQKNTLGEHVLHSNANFVRSRGFSKKHIGTDVWDPIAVGQKLDVAVYAPLKAGETGKIIHIGFAPKVKSNRGYGYFLLIETSIGEDSSGRKISKYTIMGHGQKETPQKIDYSLQLNQFQNADAVDIFVEKAAEIFFPNFEKGVLAFKTLVNQVAKLQLLNTHLFNTHEHKIEKIAQKHLDDFTEKHKDDRSPLPQALQQMHALLQKLSSHKVSAHTRLQYRRELLELLMPEDCPKHLGHIQPEKEIKAGQIVFFMGATGFSHGVHLHWEEWLLESGLGFKGFFLEIEKYRKYQIAESKRGITFTTNVTCP
jgi:hypothetical protein